MPEQKEVSPEQFEVLKAVLGADAETFKQTKLGQYIFDRIDLEEERLIEELIEVALKSSDLDIVRRAMDINMHRMLPKFIGEAVQSGHAARRNIDQMEDNSRDY